MVELQPLIWIGGQWMGAFDGSTYPVRNPADGTVLAHVPAAGRAEAAAAVEAAHQALATWREMPARERSAILHRWHQLLVRNQEMVARTLTLEQGKPLAESRAEVGAAADHILWNAEEAKRVYGEIIPAATARRRTLVMHQPVGVVAAITPWNFPCSMITRKVAPALAAGCTVVIKPANKTPLTAMALCRLLEEAGLPPGVVNLLTGDSGPIGEEFLSNPLVRKLSFTGSTEVGRVLMRGAADQIKRVSLELGGNAPFIVFADADLDKAVAAVLEAKFRNAGQTCISANRIYVHEAVLSPFVERLEARIRSLKVGPGLEEGVQMGPLIDHQAVSKVKEHVTDAVERGAKLRAGGHRLEGQPLERGSFFAPTLLVDVTDGMRIAQEETFGPVAPILSFQDEAEVVARANSTPYGLAAYVFTADLSRAWRVAESLEFGMVGVNDLGIASAQAPFGGMKQSGLGREGGHWGLEEYLEVKQVTLQLA